MAILGIGQITSEGALNTTGGAHEDPFNGTSMELLRITDPVHSTALTPQHLKLEGEMSPVVVTSLPIMAHVLHNYQSV